ncbi:helix-turn-helix domain-containing protein [Pseudodonghicola xiamenensis]|uniref:4-hydroxy-3-methylbut-2-en-1-yl diphosphate synthase n=1 Tax=Pseudodonghicola xiamenensis TaxID=337702 RepID=A0A8J3H4B6_9RHOB|nr:helix-turn-helix domain-containing protein [Pseudodonghicola xiamenensis]GHG79072.1 4-hydroxy-3-methylbut-2-en-1-yl diphosphate synthase [Pseudodonghicola xiamenensis]
MIGRKLQRKSEEDKAVELKGFDDFEVRLGDMMRGERATMGKSLLDVQRELRIKANYIAAIENTDPSAFDTPGFIAGYVRSYARYLNMDPDIAFAAFCRESGFTVAHGMSSQASGVRPGRVVEKKLSQGGERDPFTAPNTPFIPEREGFFSQIEPRAVGSSLVLLALIAGIGYGGWTVLKEVQQVQVAPVEQVPMVLSDLDPLKGAVASRAAGDENDAPSAEALDRLYRPQALDVPVLMARDAPISTLDPRSVGTLAAPELPQVQIASAEPVRPEESVPQVVEQAAPHLAMVAVRPSWVRVRAADGSVIFEGIMESGQTYQIPATEEPPTLRAGESGAIYFAVNGKHYGPVGERGVVTSKLPLSIDAVTQRYQVADLQQDRDLARMVAEAQTTQTEGQ